MGLVNARKAVNPGKQRPASGLNLFEGMCKKPPFALTLYNYFLEIREQDNDLPPEVMNAVNMLLEKGAVPSLAKELTPEVREVFRKMFVL